MVIGQFKPLLTIENGLYDTSITQGKESSHAGIHHPIQECLPPLRSHKLF
jgi:hypothetical protein